MGLTPFAESCGYSLGHFDAAAYRNEVDILGMSVQEYVAYISTNHITWPGQGVGYIADVVKYRLINLIGEIHSLLLVVNAWFANMIIRG